jgi:regulator of cell morphogenesis and NO signaling
MPGGAVSQDPRIIDKEAREAWKAAPIAELIRHIVERYHLETRVEMARLESIAEGAVLLDGQHSPLLLEIRAEVNRLGTEMRAHLSYEERETFPAILASQAAGRPLALLEPMKQTLLDEHEAEAALVRRLRTLAEGLSLLQDPRGANAKLQSSLKNLAENLQQHLFLENQILFPRVF